MTPLCHSWDFCLTCLFCGWCWWIEASVQKVGSKDHFTHTSSFNPPSPSQSPSRSPLPSPSPCHHHRHYHHQPHHSCRIKRHSPSGDDRQGDVAQDGADCLSAITQLLGKSGFFFMCLLSWLSQEDSWSHQLHFCWSTSFSLQHLLHFRQRAKWKLRNFVVNIVDNLG